MTQRLTNLAGLFNTLSRIRTWQITHDIHAGLLDFTVVV